MALLQKTREKAYVMMLTGDSPFAFLMLEAFNSCKIWNQSKKVFRGVRNFASHPVRL